MLKNNLITILEKTPTHTHPFCLIMLYKADAGRRGKIDSTKGKRIQSQSAVCSIALKSLG